MVQLNSLLLDSGVRSYWIPGSYAPLLSEKHNSFLRLLKNKAFKEEVVYLQRTDNSSAPKNR
jgi:hypothetical protein